MPSDNKARILREGEKFVQQGKIAQAIHEYLKVVKEEPDDVQIQNTLGDLYLRQSSVSEANKLFHRVAESYARNNFFLKAIAVYKKILTTEPENLEVNMQLASLFAQQGLNVDARNQYLRVGDLCAREGMAIESLEAYEKVIEIDPMNVNLQLKLADAYLAQNNPEKAYLLFAGAARAQMKAGDIEGAMTSFRQTLALNWSSSEALKGFLESALNAGNLRGALGQISECVRSFPDDPALQALLGRAYQASGDLDQAEQCFHSILNHDESHYVHLLSLSQAFLQAGDPDRALRCLHPVVPIVISRRETEKLVDTYERILVDHPDHLETVEKLAEILSAANQTDRYLDVLDTLVALYRASENLQEAVETLEKILEIKPDSQDHLDQHRDLFSQAYPDILYHLPRGVLNARQVPGVRHEVPSRPAEPHAKSEDGSSSSIVEIDLLLNYGLKEKALQLLKGMEAANPIDAEVRQRLLDLYRESGEVRLAAEQCVLLSAIHQKSGNAEAAQNSLAEARTLAPDWAHADLDVASVAREHGIKLDIPRSDASVSRPGHSMEMDLSGDLSEIFFQDAKAEGRELLEMPETGLETSSDAGVEDFPQAIPRPPAPESVEEQLQEVDFYIRLGFHDEARAKLDEIAATFPHHPELGSRLAQLGGEPSEAAPAIAPVPPEPASQPHAAELEMEPIALDGAMMLNLDAAFPDFNAGESPANDLGAAVDQFGENNWFDSASEAIIELPPVEELNQASPPSPDPVVAPQANTMFSDLIAEVNSLTDQEIAREDFETHFNLGIAYREMGLVDDAIREFQSSLKAIDPERSPKEVIQCCGMLSTCFLEKGMSRSAIRWCQTGLGIREISPHEAIALRYDMGVAHVTAGELERAFECFGAIFDIDPSYRDVAQKIDDLKIGLERHAP